MNWPAACKPLQDLEAAGLVKDATAAKVPAAKRLAAYKLPAPPSANALFVTRGGRRFKSPSYRAWRAFAGLQLLRQSVVFVQHPFAVRIVVVGGKDWNVQRDVDNVIKPIVDLLRMAKVIQNDSCLHMVDVSARFERHEGATSWCCVEVEALRAPPRPPRTPHSCRVRRRRGQR